MKNYLERFVGNPHSFQRKIITIYLVLTIIPMLLIALIITGVYYQRILDSAYNILNENAQQHEIIVQEKMMEASDQTIVIADSTKLGVNSLVKMCDINRVGMIITDSDATKEQIRPFEQAGISVEKPEN